MRATSKRDSLQRTSLPYPTPLRLYHADLILPTIRACQGGEPLPKGGAAASEGLIEPQMVRERRCHSLLTVPTSESSTYVPVCGVPKATGTLNPSEWHVYTEERVVRSTVVGNHRVTNLFCDLVQTRSVSRAPLPPVCRPRCFPCTMAVAYTPEPMDVDTSPHMLRPARTGEPLPNSTQRDPRAKRRASTSLSLSYIEGS